MRLEARALGFGYPRQARRPGRHASRSRPARSSACSARTAAARRRCSRRCSACCRPRAGGSCSTARPCARLAAREIARRDRLRAAGACRRTFPFTVRDVVTDGPHRASRAVRARRARATMRPRRRRSTTLGIARPGGCRLHPDQRRRAAAGADRPRARAGGAADRHGRADREPRFRQPGARAARDPRARAREGNGIVLSTHDPDHAFACADRVALLHDGGLVAIGPPSDVLSPARLEAVYGAAGARRAPGRRPHRVRARPQRAIDGAAAGLTAGQACSLPRRTGRIAV